MQVLCFAYENELDRENGEENSVEKLLAERGFCRKSLLLGRCFGYIRKLRNNTEPLLTRLIQSHNWDRQT